MLLKGDIQTCMSYMSMICLINVKRSKDFINQDQSQKLIKHFYWWLPKGSNSLANIPAEKNGPMIMLWKAEYQYQYENEMNLML